MAVLCVPPIPAVGEDALWPSLGPQVCDWIENNLTFGPGDLRDEPARLDDDKRALICRAYQVYPPGAVNDAGEPIAGRRRFKKVTIELPKGSAKTELLAWVTAAEMAPNAPVRCAWYDSAGQHHAEFYADGQPVGRPVTDPYVPLVAYTEEQSDELAYGALKVILRSSEVAHLFDIGEERITRADGSGRCVSLAGSPNARDGARTTFQGFDEPHRMFSAALKKARQTMLANIPKRRGADAWTLDTTTRHDPSENSVHQAEYEAAQLIKAGVANDPTVFFFSRYADRDKHNILVDGKLRDGITNQELRAALAEAAGSASSFRDFDSVISQFRSPTSDLAYLCRTYLNWSMSGAGKAFDVDRIKTKLVTSDSPVNAGDRIATGFDGSLKKDATGLIGTHLRTGYQWVIAVWERPADADEDWEVPRDEVDGVVTETFQTFDVVRFHADPEYWDDMVSAWAGRYNHGRHGKVVFATLTNQPKKQGLRNRSYRLAMDTGTVSFAPDGTFLRHLGNAYRRKVPFYVDEEQLYLIEKERRSSSLVIDLAMAGCLSWDAYLDALASGFDVEQAPSAGFSFTPGPA